MSDAMKLAGLGAMTVMAVALARSSAKAAYTSFPVSGFFEPDKVVSLADEIPADTEDEFILAAWDYVGREIAYEPVGTDLEFQDGVVLCDVCYSVEQTLQREMANCVGKSALLCSLLLNRLEPGRVWMVVGQYVSNNVGSGHAWVEVERGGQFYILESTMIPPAMPWKPAASDARYVPYTIFSQAEFTCLDSQFCVRLGGCPTCGHPPISCDCTRR